MEAMTHGGSANDEDLVASEYLTFTLGSEEYAIDILKVQEIRGYEQPTLIANAPPFIKGVINLRGIIVPIVDLRIKFNLGKFEYTPFTVVIILNVAGISKRFGGLQTIDSRMMIVTDIERLMTSADMALIDSASE